MLQLLDSLTNASNCLPCSLLETQTQVTREREQREQQVMATLEMMSLFKLHVQQVTSARCISRRLCFSLFVLQSLKDVEKRFGEILEEISQ
jgi:hypothetical protein